MRSTVLPTPAPPKRPILPPRRYGARRSMTLMPVSNASIFTFCSTSVGGGRWIGNRRVAFTGPRSSTGAPLHAARHADRGAGVLHRHAADEAVGRVHGDAAGRVLAEVLGDLDDEVVGPRVDGGVRHRARRVDVGQRAGRELHVHHRADDLGDLAALNVRRGHVCLSGSYLSASAPLTISMSSFVTAAWRARLYWRGSIEIISSAFFVADSMALMRAPCSEAADSRRARHTCIARWRGTRSLRSASREGSYLKST